MLRSIFIGPEGRARLGWRIVLYTLAFVLAQVAGDLAAMGARALGLDGASHPLGAAVTILAALGLFVFLRRKVDRATGQEVAGGLGLAAPRQAIAWIPIGFLTGVALVGAMFWLEQGLGWLEVGGRAGGAQSAVIALSLSAIAGVGEELAFRGALLQAVGERTPVWLAILILGLVFGALHVLSVGHLTPAFLINSVLVTAAFSLSRLAFGNLWWAMGLHAAWDWTQVVLGLSSFPGSGGNLALVQVTQHGPPEWVGTALAIENGWLTTFAVGLLVLLFSALLRARGVDLRARLDRSGAPAARALQPA